MITLYGQPLSSYTAKVRVALHWRGLAFEEREPPGGYQSAAWRQRVPMGTLPALEHDGFFLAESEAILEYLEDAFAERPLMPGSAQARARVRTLARLHDLHVEPRVRALFPLIRQPQQRARLPELLSALDDKMQRLTKLRSPSPTWPAPSPAWPIAVLPSPCPWRKDCSKNSDKPGACLRHWPPGPKPWIETNPCKPHCPPGAKPPKPG